jgi:hypothetical protein
MFTDTILIVINASCMSEDMSALHELVSESMLFNWRPKYYIKTTGTAANAIYGTGTRKKVTIADFSAAKKIFNKWNVPKADRFVVLSTEMSEESTGWESQRTPEHYDGSRQ